MRAKYLGDAGIYGIKNRDQDSALWSDMLHIKEIYLCGRRMQIGDGKRTDFRGDVWCGSVSFKEKYADLFEICQEQNVSVARARSFG
jgi:hypothetical protein